MGTSKPLSAEDAAEVERIVNGIDPDWIEEEALEPYRPLTGIWAEEADRLAKLAASSK